ncbi:MAG: YloN [uncultured bacterium]|nr:MAG: YloN [uncultured bacterium]
MASPPSAPPSRRELFNQLFPLEKSFRWKQIEEAFYKPHFKGWEDVLTLSKSMRETLAAQMPWMSHEEVQVFVSGQKDTYKAILQLADTQRIETVLMANRRGQWTICVSSQVGCAMKCGFCATGKMGLLRNLTVDEIADQYRFWIQYLTLHPELPQRISNVVFMGMGEPLANYENVKATLNTWLNYTDIGPTHITVSTVGVLPVLEKILVDPEWPHVRLALSLHSADGQTRKDIIPTSHDQFLPLIQNWIERYLEQFGNRRHHFTFEYVMLKNVNDTVHHAEVLAELANALGHIKLNLIPYNFTDLGFERSKDEQIKRFKGILEKRLVSVTVRKTMGDDIAAACGQLITLGAKKN